MARKNRAKNAPATQRFSDGITNPLLRIGNYTRNTFSATFYGPEFSSLNRTQLEWAYQSSWLCGLAVDILAEDMTREGIELKGIDPELAERLEAQFDNKGIWGDLTDTIKWSRLYGGSIAVMLIDGEDMSTPLNIAGLSRGSFKGLYALDRWQVMPSNDLVQELGRDFGKPVSYEILPGVSGFQLPGKNAKVHHSRVLRFDGVTLPFYLRQAYQYWGASVLERVFPRIKAFDEATQSAAQLLSKVYLRYYKVKGLRQVLTNEQAAKGFRRQMDVVREMQGIEGMTVGDAEDDFQTFSYTFAGLPDVLLQFGQQVSGAIGVPLVRLFGQSPVGFNSTGEMDLRLYYDDVKRQQDASLRENLKRLLKVMYASETGRPADADMSFEFRPLWQLRAETQATTAQTNAATIMQAFDAQLISAPRALEELKRQSAVTGIFSTITDEEIQEAREQEDVEPPELGAMNEVQADPIGEVVQAATVEDRTANPSDREGVPGRDKPADAG